MKPIRLALLCGAMALYAVSVSAQQPTQQSSSAPAHSALGDTWGHLKALPPHTHMHVAADHGSSTCYLIAVDDTALTCGRHNGSPKGQHVFPRAEVKSVKLTRYGVSTAGGLGIGAGIGTAIGFAASRSSSSSSFSLKGLGNGVVRGVSAVAGGLGGGAIGGSTDMFRGPTIYRRINAKG